MPLFPSARPYAVSDGRNAATVSRERLLPPASTCEGATLGVKSELLAVLRRPRRCIVCGLHSLGQCKAQKGATKTVYASRRPRAPLRLRLAVHALPSPASACMSQVNCV